MASYDEFDGALGEEFLQDSAHPEEEVVFDDDAPPPSLDRTITSPSSPPAANTRSRKNAGVSPLHIDFSPAIRSAKKKKGHGETKLRNEMEAMLARQGSFGAMGEGYDGHPSRKNRWFWRLLVILLLTFIIFAAISVKKDPTLPLRAREFLQAAPHAQTYKLQLDSMQQELWSALSDSSSLRLDLQMAQEKARGDRQQAQIVRAQMKTMEEKYEKISAEQRESEQIITLLKGQLKEARSTKEIETSQLKQHKQQIGDLLQKYDSERSKRKALELEKERVLAQLKEARQQVESVQAQLLETEGKLQDFQRGLVSSNATEFDREELAKEISERKQIESARLMIQMDGLRREREEKLATEIQQLKESREREALRELERTKQEREAMLNAELKRKRAEKEKQIDIDLQALQKEKETELINEFSQKVLNLQHLDQSASVVTPMKHAVESIQVHVEKARDKVVKSGPSIAIPAMEPSVLIKAGFKDGEPVLAVPKVFGRVKENVPNVVNKVKHAATNSTKEILKRGQDGSRAASTAVLRSTKKALNRGRKTSKAFGDQVATSVQKLSRAGVKQLVATRASLQSNAKALGHASVENTKKIASGLEKQIDAMALAGTSKLSRGWDSATMIGSTFVHQTEELVMSVTYTAKDIADHAWEAFSLTMYHSAATVNDAVSATSKYIAKQSTSVARTTGIIAAGGYRKLSNGTKEALKYTELKSAVVQEALTTTWSGILNETATALMSIVENAREVFVNAEVLVQKRSQNGSIDAQ